MAGGGKGRANRHVWFKPKVDFVLEKKPYPDEVMEARPAVAARLEALLDIPPSFFDPYTVRVVLFAARIFRRRVAATPRPRRGYSVETERGSAVQTGARLRYARSAPGRNGARLRSTPALACTFAARILRGRVAVPPRPRRG